MQLSFPSIFTYPSSMIRQQVFTLLEVSFQVAYIHLITNDLSKKRILPTSSYLLKISTTSIKTKDQRKWV